jgi:hypothetical protein
MERRKLLVFFNVALLLCAKIIMLSFVQGGPGGILASMTGGFVTDGSWKCAGFEANQNPDDVYPNWNLEEFNDDSWLPAQVSGVVCNNLV